MRVRIGWIKQIVIMGAFASSLTLSSNTLAQKVLDAPPQTDSAGVDISKQVGIDQKLNAALPLDTEFRDHTGKTVKLRDFFGTKPLILVTPFYKCRGSCALELDGMAKCFRDMDFQIGKEFNVLTVSIHPKETPEMAAVKKAEFEDLYKRAGADSGWNFLVGNWESIKSLTDAVGFRFIYDPIKDNIAHAAGITIITPQGRVSRYFYGVNYDPKQVRLALVEASSGKIGTLADKVTLYCSSFDMLRGKYTPNIMKIIQVLGVSTAIALAGMIALLTRYKTKPVPPESGQTPTMPQPMA